MFFLDVYSIVTCRYWLFTYKSIHTPVSSRRSRRNSWKLQGSTWHQMEQKETFGEAPRKRELRLRPGSGLQVSHPQVDKVLELYII